MTPPLARCICMTFRAGEDQRAFLERCMTLHLPDPIETDISVNGDPQIMKWGGPQKRELLSVDHLISMDRRKAI